VNTAITARISRDDRPADLEHGVAVRLLRGASSPGFSRKRSATKIVADDPDADRPTATQKNGREQVRGSWRSWPCG
jgi:hypothetical protein